MQALSHTLHNFHQFVSCHFYSASCFKPEHSLTEIQDVTLLKKVHLPPCSAVFCSYDASGLISNASWRSTPVPCASGFSNAGKVVPSTLQRGGRRPAANPLKVTGLAAWRKSTSRVCLRKLHSVAAPVTQFGIRPVGAVQKADVSRFCRVILVR